MLRGLISFQLFVDDVAAVERWYAGAAGHRAVLPPEDMGLPAEHLGFRVGDYQSELGSPTASSRPAGSGLDRPAPSRTGRSTT
jgi:hypothetical protein